MTRDYLLCRPIKLTKESSFKKSYILFHFSNQDINKVFFFKWCLNSIFLVGQQETLCTHTLSHLFTISHTNTHFSCLFLVSCLNTKKHSQAATCGPSKKAHNCYDAGCRLCSANISMNKYSLICIVLVNILISSVQIHV